VDCDIYIPEACPFCRHVKEVVTKLDLLVKMFLHHIMHYKPNWISSMDACNHNHETCEIICAKGGVFRCIHVTRALFAIGICQKCWQKRTICWIIPQLLFLNLSCQKRSNNLKFKVLVPSFIQQLKFFHHAKSLIPHVLKLQLSCSLLFEMMVLWCFDYIWFSRWGYAHMSVILFGIGHGCNSIFIAIRG
jgi:hypothetical protein